MRQYFKPALVLLLGALTIPALAEGEKGKWECKAGAGGWDCNWSGQGAAPEPEKVEKKTYPEYAPKTSEQGAQTEVVTQPLVEPEAQPQTQAQSQTQSQPAEPAASEARPEPAAEPAPASKARTAAPASAWEMPVPKPAANKARVQSAQPAVAKPASTGFVEDDIDEAPGRPAVQTAPVQANTAPFEDISVRPAPKPAPRPAASLEPQQQTTEAAPADKAASGTGMVGTLKSWLGWGKSKPEEPKPQAAQAAGAGKGMGLDRKVQAVQIHASANLKELEAIQGSHSFEKPTWILTETRNSAPWYCLLTGPYADLHQALNAIEVMPNTLQQYSPWVRRVSAP